MTRILLDQNAPIGLRQILSAHEVVTAHHMGWAALSNGELIAAADSAGFDVLVTADRNLRYQQSIAARRIAIVVLGTNHWRVIQQDPAAVIDAVSEAKAGAFVEILYD